VLDTYAAQRREVADRVVKLADRLTEMATLSARKRPLRNIVMRIAGRVPAVRRRLAVRLSGLDRR
jgi:2-polyprenyl-6-methoxyphenol hydroxylase-like FAD-dependent oxidoreductase